MENYEFEQDVRTIEDKVLFKRLYKYITPYKRKFIFALTTLVLVTFIFMLEPIALKFTVDSLTIGEVEFNYFAKVLIGFAILISFAVIARYLASIKIAEVGQGIVYDMRDELFTHLEDFSIDYFNNQKIGRLTTRLTSDINSVSQMFTSVIVNLITATISIIIVVSFMIHYSTKITLYAMIIMPFVIVSSIVFRYYSRKIYRKIRTQTSKLNGFLAESLSGMAIIQIFNQQETKLEEFEVQNETLKKFFYQRILVFSTYRPFIYLLYMASTTLVYYLGGMDVIDGLVTLGTLVLMSEYVTRFFQPIQTLAEQYDIIQSSFASGERIFAILDTEKTVKDDGKQIQVEKIEGKIEFKHVWFSYVADEWILKDVSFVIEAKKSCAFVGATGAGKTTILALITRNYDVNRGEVLIDGINVRDYDINSLRKCMGQMLQDVFMFSGTIESNINLRSTNITHDEVVEACKYVNADKFIEQQDHKYEEEVLERGNNFSTGQRQLISFARTVVHKPNVMILDEATSNIDTETEQLIQLSLEKMMNIGTMLIVAHRLSTIQKVDNIVVLSHGEIIESGNHQELLRKKGMYYELYKIQYHGKV